VTLKIKHHDFKLTTRRRTLGEPVTSAAELLALAEHLLNTPAPPGKPVRLLGLTLSNFDAAAVRQLSLHI
jgi:DNA polymerase-4